MRCSSLPCLIALLTALACGAEVPSRGPGHAPAQAARATPEPATSEDQAPRFVADPEAPPTPDGAPLLRPALPIVTGPLDAALVRAKIHAQLDELRGCYAAALPPAPDLAGVVTLLFTIDARGEVRETEARQGPFAQPRVPACMARAVSRWSFAPPASAGDTEVSVSFELRPSAP